MDESIIRASVLFFALSLKDKELVYSASQAALTSARRKKYQNELESLMSLVIAESVKLYRSRKLNALPRRTLEIENLPSQELLNEIKVLQERVSEGQFIPFLWNEIIKVPLLDIASGLKESIGTIEHRCDQVFKTWVEAE